MGEETYSWFASLSGKSDSSEALGRAIRKVVVLVITVYIPVGFLFMTLLPAGLSRYVQNLHSDSERVVWWLGLVLALAATTRFIRVSIPSIGLSGQLLAVDVAGVASGGLIGYFAIALRGTEGMAIGVFCSELLSFVLQVGLIRRRLRGTELFRPPWHILWGTFMLATAYHSLKYLGAPRLLTLAAPVLLYASAAAWRLLATRYRRHAATTPF